MHDASAPPPTLWIRSEMPGNGGPLSAWLGRNMDGVTAFLCGSRRRKAESRRETVGRARLRDLGISIGRLPPGPLNAITDVSGVLVGHCTVVWDAPRIARTGVTMVVPRSGAI